MAIFHCYVSSPEGNGFNESPTSPEIFGTKKRWAHELGLNCTVLGTWSVPAALRPDVELRFSRFQDIAISCWRGKMFETLGKCWKMLERYRPKKEKSGGKIMSSSCPGHPGLLPSCTELRIDKEEPKCAKSKAWKMVQQQLPQCFYMFLQCGAPKIAKLVYNSNNYDLW